MAQTQGKGGNAQTVEKAETHISEPAKLNRALKCGFTDEEIFKVANSRLGWYRRCGMYVVNFILNPEILGYKTKGRPGLVDPLAYYLS